jgi:hypothetical protein
MAVRCSLASASPRKADRAYERILKMLPDVENDERRNEITQKLTELRERLEEEQHRVTSTTYDPNTGVVCFV